MEKKYLLVSMNDLKSKKIAEVLSSESCKKIIDFLADKEDISEQEISKALRIPLNTVGYNMKKLVDSDIVEKNKNKLWSVKGREISRYRLSNKSIIISPSSKGRISSKIKSLLPAVLISGIAGLIVKYYYDSRFIIESEMAGASLKASSDLAFSGQKVVEVISSTSWLWFLAGALISLIIISLINWRKL